MILWKSIFRGQREKFKEINPDLAAVYFNFLENEEAIELAMSLNEALQKDKDS